MTSILEEQLNTKVANFSPRASGEELYEYMTEVSEAALRESREQFVIAMMHWLQLRSEPKTMLAVSLAGDYRLSELYIELEKLLDDVRRGRVFKEYYGRPIEKTLSELQATPD